MRLDLLLRFAWTVDWIKDVFDLSEGISRRDYGVYARQRDRALDKPYLISSWAHELLCSHRSRLVDFSWRIVGSAS